MEFSWSDEGETDFDWSDEDETDFDNLEVGSSSANQSNRLFQHFVGMGYSDKIVTRAVEENENADEDSVLNTILTFIALENSPTRNQVVETMLTKFLDGDSDLKNDCEDSDFMSSDDEKMAMESSPTRNLDAEITLTKAPDDDSDFMWSDDEQIPHENYLDDSDCCPELEATHGFKKKQKTGNGPSCTIRLPNPIHKTRKLPEEAVGPPYFYCELVARTPKGVWDEISRHLYGIAPEFVDSKFFCAAARKRGYVHNLPISNRFRILPIPPLTIQEALPDTKAWWPAWDQRTKLNSFSTAYAGAKLSKKIREKLEPYNGVEPPPSDKNDVLKWSKKWNLVWVGHNKVCDLEPNEIEMLLGFPKNHTRGLTRTDCYKSLGSAFQVDTVAYHLSVLKRLLPSGINVLSLFSGIGGAEVALHRLGIPLKVVVSVEKSEANQSIIEAWWEQTNQVGELVHMSDVQELTNAKLKGMVVEFGGFDLVIGGIPCNNLAGRNRNSRDGLEGKESHLFYEYTRILKEVRRIMGGRRA